jgi:5-methyltetrahydrofolate--homocysteine methyltransferase
MSITEQRLRDLLARRILILDGAMGTMIQRYTLSEAQYRGALLAEFEHDVKGNNELLSLTQPQVIRRDPRGLPGRGRGHHRDQHLRRDHHRPGRLSPGRTWPADMNRASARLARAACDKFSTRERPRFVAGALGPQPKTASISPDVNDPGARNVTFDELRGAYAEQTAG